MITRTFSAGSPTSVAIRSLVGNGVWVDAQTVSLPSFIAATAAWGSIGAWAT